MLAHAVESIAAIDPVHVIDLGAGTGALSERLLEATAATVVELWDVDDAMLTVARERLARFGQRAKFVHRSFDDPVPPTDAVAASLALHHMRDLGAKTTLYRRIAEALRAGGVVVNADVMLPADPSDREARHSALGTRHSALGTRHSKVKR
jgi:SAM-dependent methyltransferase